MPYGFAKKEDAEVQAADLRVRYPDRRYEVAPHSWLPGKPNRMFQPGSGDELFARTWGVVEYVKTDSPNLPERLTGFHFL